MKIRHFSVLLCIFLLACGRDVHLHHLSHPSYDVDDQLDLMFDVCGNNIDESKQKMLLYDLKCIDEFSTFLIEDNADSVLAESYHVYQYASSMNNNTALESYVLMCHPNSTIVKYVVFNSYGPYGGGYSYDNSTPDIMLSMLSSFENYYSWSTEIYYYSEESLSNIDTLNNDKWLRLNNFEEAKERIRNNGFLHLVILTNYKSQYEVDFEINIIPSQYVWGYMIGVRNMDSVTLATKTHFSDYFDFDSSSSKVTRRIKVFSLSSYRRYY